MKKRRGMVAFYISTGVAVALLVAGYFAWMPLSVWYWERTAKTCLANGRAVDAVEPEGGLIMPTSELQEAIRELAELGPIAEPAVRRLLGAASEQECVVLLIALGRSSRPWMASSIALVIRSRAQQRFALAKALPVAESICGTNMGGGPDLARPKLGLNERRKAFLAWWQREGKAKYGSGK